MKVSFDPKNNPEDARAVRDLFGEIRIAIDRGIEREAMGWVVLVRDLESQEEVSTYGIFEQPEQALAWATKQDADPQGGRVVDGEPGWSHTVLPLYDGSAV